MSIDLVSVVIPVLNGADTLDECLTSLERQEAPFEIEVVVVDSGSTDGSLQIAQRRAHRVLEISPADFNHGTTRNHGIEGSTGEIVCLLTQDATPVSDRFLSRLVAPFDDPHVDGVYGRQVPRPDCDVVTRRSLEAWLTGRTSPARSQLEAQTLDELHPAERHRLCVFDNVCSALRRSTWAKMPFRRVTFGEDIDWGCRIIRDGGVIVYEPSAAVLHSHRRSVGYEFGRTRICHATLHQLFGLATLPRLRDVARASVGNLRGDLPYVWRTAPAGRERLRQMARAAALSVASPIAQHLGFRDASSSSPS